MKKSMMMKSIFLMTVVLFVVSFANVALSGEEAQKMEAEKIMTISGSVITVNPHTGKVEVKDESGQMVSLKAGSDINLGDLTEGQRVTFEYGDDGVIKKMHK